MRKTAFIAAAAIAFDLGVIVSAGHAADNAFLKLQGQPNAQAKTTDFFLKLDAKLTPRACMAHNGMVTSKNGVQGCQFQTQAEANSALQDVSTTR